MPQTALLIESMAQEAAFAAQYPPEPEESRNDRNGDELDAEPWPTAGEVHGRERFDPGDPMARRRKSGSAGISGRLAAGLAALDAVSSRQEAGRDSGLHDYLLEIPVVAGGRVTREDPTEDLVHHSLP